MPSAIPEFRSWPAAVIVASLLGNPGSAYGSDGKDATEPASEPVAVTVCRRAPNDAERIACLEAALTDHRNAGASVIGTKGELREELPPQTDSPPESKQPKLMEPKSAEGIGAQQVRLRNQTGADARARLESASGLRVARYAEVPYGRLQIELENGQIWRQIAGDTQRFRVDLRRNQTVDINESGISGYKLRLNELERTIRVERIR